MGQSGRVAALEQLVFEPCDLVQAIDDLTYQLSYAKAAAFSIIEQAELETENDPTGLAPGALYFQKVLKKDAQFIDSQLLPIL